MFEAVSQFTVHPVDKLIPRSAKTASEGETTPGQQQQVARSLFGESNCLQSLEVRQLLFALRPKLARNPSAATPTAAPGGGEAAEDAVFPVSVRHITQVGKMDMCWRSLMGEKGRLQTSALQRSSAAAASQLLAADVRLTLERVPSAVLLESPFTVACRVLNARYSIATVSLLDRSLNTP